jgi:phospholipase C
MVEAMLPQIKNIVFLMLENRSLDNVLGWVYRTTSPQYVFPDASPAVYDGLQTGAYQNPSYTWTGAVKYYPVVPVPGNLGGDADRVPAYDPYEEMKIEGSWKGVLNQIFGTQDTISGLPSGSAPPPAMQGFLQDYYAGYMAGWQGLDILWTYTPPQLPAINNLAHTYALSDRWFCSVPSQTNPNRAYSICGTSLGRESNLNLFAVEQFDVPTVFNQLAGAGKSWGLYFTDVWRENKSYTEYTFPQISRATGNSDIGPIATFLHRAQSGTLPDFTYLEPTWGYGKGAFYKQGTDYHPPTHVVPGDQFLQSVYSAVRSGPQWSQSLLIVTFDEHGGTFDHRGPPGGAINPDGMKGPSGFNFDRFGVRVPTLLISPFVRQSTVFREPAGSPYPYDHTSFIKTLLLWAGVDPGSVNMGARMPKAPTFEGALATDHVNTAVVQTTPPPASNTAPMSAADAQGLPPAGSGRPLDALFDGITFAATRAILTTNASIEGIQQDIRRYRLDPEQFESALAAPA